MKKSLPKNPILITFDDGYYDNYTRGYPLLKKYNMQGTIFIIGENIKETSNVSNVGGLDRLSWENIYAMKSHVTVQSHTYASHIKGISPKGKSIGVMATHLKGATVDMKLKVGENQLFVLDQDGKVIEGAMKDLYILKKN